MIYLKNEFYNSRLSGEALGLTFSIQTDDRDDDYMFNGSIGMRFWTVKDIVAYAKEAGVDYEQALTELVQISEVDPVNNIVLFVKHSDLLLTAVA